MILEGFEIENWSCIHRLAVHDLPPTGVIVLAGPNGTGKTSILEALRACLMDNKSTSKALARGFSKLTTDKPRVTVSFRAGGATWKIMKQFNSKESTLHRRTDAGEWKLETADATEAHERTRQLTGGCDSTAGLYQLLWLTQTEFHLPEPKQFDADVQSHLRTILGVLQTPLDDSFLRRVKAEWSRWYGARSKPGAKPKLKNDCPLDKSLALLDKSKKELAEIEASFQLFESLLEKSTQLDVRSRHLNSELAKQAEAHARLQEEYEVSLKRLEAHELAGHQLAQAEEKLDAVVKLRERRMDAERRLREETDAANRAALDAEEAQIRLRNAEKVLRTLRQQSADLSDKGRRLQERRDAVVERLAYLDSHEQFRQAKAALAAAEQVSGVYHHLKQESLKLAAPDESTMNALEENHSRATKLRADLDAAAIVVTLTPDNGAAAPRLTIDGKEISGAQTNTAELEHSVRRHADVLIPGWGRLKVARGSDTRSLEQIEAALCECDRVFAAAIGPFGIASSDPTALDHLKRLVANKKAREPEIQRVEQELKHLAPAGIDVLREEAARRERLLQARDAAGTQKTEVPDLPATKSELDRLSQQLKEEMDQLQVAGNLVEAEIQRLEQSIEGDGDPASKKARTGVPGLRRQEAVARERLIALTATAGSVQSELDRMLTPEQIDEETRLAEDSVAAARTQAEAARLSEGEETINDRLEMAKEAEKACQVQLARVREEYHHIKGRLETAEGLHQKRAAAAARVDELTRLTERETHESAAYDRLYALFEECRDKQLGTVLKPIQDRVQGWMKLLRIPAYESIRFNDQFLPEKLLTRGDVMEISLAEESTGTIEQLALMVRLALGATLSKPEEPVVAMLDDPLTHSDVVRLDRMRAVLRNAAVGVAPAGPMQICVFTCHPEWFAIDGARIVDLTRPEVMTRAAVDRPYP